MTDLIKRLRTYRLNGDHIFLAVVVSVFAVLSCGVTFTRRPWCDEGWFADIAYNVMHRGVMGLTLLDSHGFVFAPTVEGIDRYTYWILPGYTIAQSAWYSVVGFSVFTMRLLSVLFGCVALVSWYVVVRYISGRERVALTSVLVLALDQNFIMSGASGRMDMMCAALGLSACAIYLRLRARINYAIFAAACILAAALMTHPNAIFGAMLLTLIVVAYDRAHIGVATLSIAALPFLIVLSVWAIYVLQAPTVFESQMKAQFNIPHRFEIHLNVLEQFRHEFVARYAHAYHLAEKSLAFKSTGLIVILYAAGSLGLLCISSLRRHAGVRVIAMFLLSAFTLLSCLQDNWYYLVYILPAFAVAVAFCADWALRRHTVNIHILLAAAAVIVDLNLMPVGFRILHNDYHGRYGAAVEYLKNNSHANDLIMGSGELAFELGFDGRVVDDCRLGFLSGRRPEYIVLEAQYYRFWFPSLAAHEQQAYAYVSETLANNYEVVYDQKRDSFSSFGSSDAPYRIFRRKRALHDNVTPKDSN
jgi:4-amino-4-deoxy-L-arabinose transferase-like glycosyltransferase